MESDKDILQKLYGEQADLDKKDIEFIASSNFGTGTTVYQGDNRFSLKDILFFQNKLEIRKSQKEVLKKINYLI